MNTDYGYTLICTYDIIRYKSIFSHYDIEKDKVTKVTVDCQIDCAINSTSDRLDKMVSISG